jgi:hypothetical protein
VVTLSSSYTKEALELLSLSPARGPHSQLSGLRSSSGSDLFEDWPEANDMAASVYVALTADALSSRTSIVNVMRGDQKSCADGSSTQQSHLWVTSSWRPHRQKPTPVDAARMKSTKTKIDVGRTLAAPTAHGGSFSTADFDKSE